MNREILKRIFGLFCALALCTGIFAPVSAAASDTAAELQPAEIMTDGAAFGEWISGEITAPDKTVWTNDALSDSEMKSLLNNLELYPQRTGWVELDEKIAALLKPYEDSDTYTKLRAAYDYLVKNVSYSWDGYSNTYASLEAYNSFSYDYLKNLTYEPYLEKSIPDDMANRTYHVLTAKTGVCYDYAIAFAVIARYIGIQSYVHTGYFEMEYYYAGPYHHGWAVLVLEGEDYVFDPQRDARNWRQSYQNGYYFGIPEEDAWRYDPNRYPEDAEANPQRDASMMPVGAERGHKATVSAVASRSGSVAGAGDIMTGEVITLTATPNEGKSFDGWYDASGTLLSQDTSYSWTVTEDCTVYALFAGDEFYDIPVNAWYEEDVMEAVDLGLLEGVTPISFCGDMNFSRAMAVVMLARLDGADIENAPANDFADVDQDAWFADAINWAADTGLVLGKDESHFMPDDPIKREEFMAIIVRYLEYKGTILEPQELTYTDVDEIDEYALEYLQKAQSINLIQGDPGGTFRPRDTLIRSEGATVMVRLAHYLAETNTQ